MNPEEVEFAEADAALQANLDTVPTSFPISPLSNKDNATDTVFGESRFTRLRGEPYHEVDYTIEHNGVNISISLSHPLITSPDGFGGDNTGRLLWPAAVAFSYWLCGRAAFESWLRGGRGSFIEICAGGCGMPGISLAGRLGLVGGGGGGRVTLTELETGGTVDILRENVERNRCLVGERAEVVGLDVNEGEAGVGGR